MAGPCLLGAAAGVACGALQALAGASREASAGMVAGTVSIAAQAGQADSSQAPKLPEIVVYLEPVAEGVTFELPSEPARVGQRGAKFNPATLVIAAGQRVEFLNDEIDPIEHNVFSESPGNSFNLGLFPPGESRGVVFERPGTVRLYCSIHRYMDGVVFVAPTPFFAQPDANGRYEIKGVPPGQYLLKTWQKRPRYKDQSIPVTIDAADAESKSINVELSRT